MIVTNEEGSTIDESIDFFLKINHNIRISVKCGHVVVVKLATTAYAATYRNFFFLLITTL